MNDLAAVNSCSVIIMFYIMKIMNRFVWGMGFILFSGMECGIHSRMESMMLRFFEKKDQKNAKNDLTFENIMIKSWLM